MVPKAEQESWATSLILRAPCRDIQAHNRHCWCANMKYGKYVTAWAGGCQA